MERPVERLPLQRVVLATRYIQLIGGFISTGVTAWFSFAQYDLGFVFGAGAATSALIMLTGYVGMFVAYRPRDVHWHLVLSFDIFGTLSALVTLGWAATGSANLCGYASWNIVPCVISSLMSALALLLTVMSILPIVQTRKLARQGRLSRPPSIKSAKHDWFHMPDQQPPPPGSSASTIMSSGGRGSAAASGAGAGAGVGASAGSASGIEVI